MMKRIVVIVLSLVLCLTLITGCGKKEIEPIVDSNTDTIDIEELIEEDSSEEELTDEEMEKETTQIPYEIIQKQCAPDVDEEDIEYKFKFLENKTITEEPTTGKEGKDISIYYFNDTLYKINMEYFGDESVTTIYSLDDDYSSIGFLKPDEIEYYQSIKLQFEDNDIKIYVDDNEGSYDWEDSRDEKNNKYIIANDTFMYTDDYDNIYIPILLGVHDMAVCIDKTTEASLFKLNNIEVIDTFVEYDVYRDSYTGINGFTYVFPCNYESKFANLMEITYKNSTGHPIIHADFDDEHGAVFKTCQKDNIEYNHLEYWTSVYFIVIEEKELNEDWEKVDETDNYIVYDRLNNSSKFFILIPKNNTDYRLMNSAYDWTKLGGIPCIEVFQGDNVSKEDTYKIAEQFSFKVVKEIDYTDNYKDIW